MLEVKKLRSLAYDRVVVEKADYSKVDKLISGIDKGEITKDNLFDRVRKLTGRVTSAHSIKRWQIITEWFFKNAWNN